MSKKTQLSNINFNELLEGYNLLPDILFWIKDTQGLILHANNALIKHFGLRSIQQAIGKSDIDFYPDYIAVQFIQDDKRVIQGEVILNRLELSRPKSGEAYWSITSKRPLFNTDGNICGSYGVSRHLKETKSIESVVNILEKPINYIQKNYMHDISINTLAQVASLSISALERRFKKHLHISPHKYLMKTRLENARSLLVDTTNSISSIANQTGFNDISYFCKKFKHAFTQSPNMFRKTHQSALKKQASIPITGSSDNA